MFAAVRWLLAQPAGGMSPTEKLVLVTLYSMSKRDGTSFPPQDYLAKVSGLGERTVRRCLKSLTDQKLISRKHRWSGDRPISDFITVHWPDEVRELLLQGRDRPIGPVPTGQDGRKTYQIEPTRQQKEERLEDFEMVVAMPEPGNLYPTRNKIHDLIQVLRSCAIAIEWDAPGIQNMATLRPWAAVYDLDFLTAVIIDVAIKHSRSSRSKGPIKSWKYFAREIADHAGRNPRSVRGDPDGYWRLTAERLIRRHRAR